MQTTALVLGAVMLGVVPDPQPRLVRSYIVYHDPVMESQGGQRLHAVGGWNDPGPLTTAYIADMQEASWGLAVHRPVREVYADIHPLKNDGFRYTDASYLDARANNTWHQPDGVDYRAVSRDYDFARRVDSGEVDEVLISGAPYMGYWESNMAGLGGYWCNSGPTGRIASSKIYVVMGFNYERGVAEMLHSYGHRSESIMTRVYGGWSTALSRHDWDRFGHNSAQSPAPYASGSVHFPPSAVADYDYANPDTVQSSWLDWRNNYPNLTGATTSTNLQTWGGADYHRNFLKWWYKNLPHMPGRNQNDDYDRLNNWWGYLTNFNVHTESALSGGFATGGTAPPAAAFTGTAARATTNTFDDFSPKVNAAGVTVWHGQDATGWHIWSLATGGGAAVKVSAAAGTLINESPEINAAGRIVWQGFDGQDWEVFSANADGSGLVRITNNTGDDWHAVINDAGGGGRVAWEGWDGNDYEIFSASADGTNVVQVTSNTTANGRPREDQWPRISATGRIVWMGHDGSDWEVFAANADGTGLIALSSDAGDDEYPQISDTPGGAGGGGRVAWHRWISDSRTDIFTCNADGSDQRRITNDSGHDWHARMGGPTGMQIVWMSLATNSGDWEIKTAHALTGVVTTVTANAVHDQYPVVDAAGRIAWQGYDAGGGDFEVYAVLAPGDPVTQITNNSVHDRWPALVGGRLAWHADVAGGIGSATSEIYRASLIPPTVPPCTADFNGMGGVTVQDIYDFLAAWNSELPSADYNGTGGVTVQDIYDFLSDWNVGCP